MDTHDTSTEHINNFFKFVIALFFLSFLFFKLWMYDNTFTGDLENTEQDYI